MKTYTLKNSKKIDHISTKYAKSMPNLIVHYKDPEKKSRTYKEFEIVAAVKELLKKKYISEALARDIEKDFPALFRDRTLKSPKASVKIEYTVTDTALPDDIFHIIITNNTIPQNEKTDLKKSKPLFMVSKREEIDLKKSKSLFTISKHEEDEVTHARSGSIEASRVVADVINSNFSFFNDNVKNPIMPSPSLLINTNSNVNTESQLCNTHRIDFITCEFVEIEDSEDFYMYVFLDGEDYTDVLQISKETKIIIQNCDDPRHFAAIAEEHNDGWELGSLISDIIIYMQSSHDF